jgi:anti-sigma factor RsiW
MAGNLRPLPVPRSGPCERSRQWCSLRLDGELSELEQALLEKHLETCGDCRAFDLQLRSTAELLRAAPAEAPAASFEVPARRLRLPVSRRLAFVAVVAAAALGSLVGSNLHRPAPSNDQRAPQLSFLTRDLNQLRQLPRQQQKPVSPERQPGSPPEGFI